MENLTLRIETDRFGPFTLTPGVSLERLATLIQRVDDAHQRFIGSPLSQIATELEKEVVVSSIFGTNTIEGGTLSEEQTRNVLELNAATVREEEQRRVTNLKAAYDFAIQSARDPAWRLDTDFIRKLHAAITEGLSNQHNRPGDYRTNTKDLVTLVGNEAHGGRYKPPQYRGDIERLTESLVEWHGRLADAKVPALVRAPLVHLYYELIHPFWDGNGRVGRVIEATLLQAAGYRYAPFALAKHYLGHIDEYFTLFNVCRKNAEAKRPDPNEPFVQFHLEGMRVVVNGLHDRVNRLIGVLLFRNRARDMLEARDINVRQYTILMQVLSSQPTTVDEMRRAPWYASLYLKRTDKTRQRDLRGLRDAKMLWIDSKERLVPGFIKPDSEFQLGARGKG
jgi:fido (protein-threonine AMPylation protein)